ncbi:hypothetical protein SAMN04487821_114117 [Enterococcus malodoratus]|uniref:tRNA (uracil-5-)-methyltransferase n=1 Tax=Enterococcus malodoratus TaxID=71451 RepID=UPI0008C0E7EA|nr:tRNA (uracil-5-)-methyltransferase [Enterococcus malodoratus]SET55070.1 hypothetical protein SAMN04487821_114117 [Enterococcus malodoratus]
MTNQKKIITIVLSGLLLIGALGGYFYLQGERNLMGIDSSAVDWDGNKNKKSNGETDSIAIPGFSELQFAANSKQQQVNFHNPDVNDCYFKLTLLSPEGDQLWQSELIEPGKGLYTIDLANELAEGTLENAVLKYECFTYDEVQSPLNGSEINLTINVV